jgi:hypothetical protein
VIQAKEAGLSLKHCHFTHRRGCGIFPMSEMVDLNRYFPAALELVTILLRFSRVSAFPLAAPSWPGEAEFLV